MPRVKPDFKPGKRVFIIRKNEVERMKIKKLTVVDVPDDQDEFKYFYSDRKGLTVKQEECYGTKTEAHSALLSRIDQQTQNVKDTDR